MDIHTSSYTKSIVQKLKETIEVKDYHYPSKSSGCFGGPLSKRGLKLASCFPSNVLLNALVEHKFATNREEAFAIGELLIANGALINVASDSDQDHPGLQDSQNIFVRFKEDHEKLPENTQSLEKSFQQNPERRKTFMTKSSSVRSNFRNTSLVNFLKNGRSNSASRLLNREINKMNNVDESFIRKFRDMFKTSWSKECVVLGSGTKESLKTFMHENLGLHLQEEVFELVFARMDVNRDGLVDQTEFAVGMCLLANKNSESKADILFALFDTDGNDSMSKTEFTNMIMSVVGTDLKSFFSIEGAEAAFAEFLDSEYNRELLEFYNEVKEIPEKFAECLIPIEQVIRIYEKYIKVNAEKQVNISHEQREEIHQIIAQAASDGKQVVPLDTFKMAELEVLDLLQLDPFPRFKQKLRKENIRPLVNGIWLEVGLKQWEPMNKETFMKWEEKTPELFNFIKKLQSACNEAISTN